MLWVLALLFKWRMVGFFQSFLMKKFPGPLATYSTMVVCPAIAAVLGIVLVRRGRMKRFGLFSTISGGLFLVLFAAVIGRAMIAKKLGATPPNPSTPRPVENQTGLPVFPGAEGVGTRTRAGRGGKVNEVTTLADSGPGSLRAAIADPEPRIIVFHVAGLRSLVGFGWSDREPAPLSMRAATRFAAPPMVRTDAETALGHVLAEAGATRPQRDAVDQRIITEVKNKTGRIIDSPGEVGGYGALAAGTPPVDSDHDGMPDDWEQARRLDSNDPTDARADQDGDGYTNLEEYLHGRAP
jgi:hypothetical protein